MSSFDHLQLIPLSLREANEYVARYHRHHKPVPGMKFAIGVLLNEELVGVALVGRPVSRNFDDGWTLEVNRTCTDGTRNVNSFLYGAAWRVAKEMGYRRLITYTLPEESGASLRAVQWRCLGLAGGGDWSRPSRRRDSDHPLQQKLLWEASGSRRAERRKKEYLLPGEE